MATLDYWADSPFQRDSALFARWFPTLDSLIAADDPVRLFADVLEEVDWSLWEAEYPRRKGQPPIHPEHLAAATLYGMYRGIRSSRKKLATIASTSCGWSKGGTSITPPSITSAPNSAGRSKTCSSKSAALR